MNKIITLVIIFVTTVIYSQEKAFTIVNKQVSWQKIYESTKSALEIKKILMTNGKIKFNNNESDNNNLSGDISDFIMDFKGAGYTRMGTPNYLSNSSKFSGNFKMEFKEGKYRVSISNIKFKGDSWSLYSGGIGVSSNGDDNLESFALTKDREYFKGQFQGRSSSIIDHSFSDLFDVSKYDIKNDENW
ncbi:hypothetical protein SAMN05421866_4175 [Chryseobacterium oranimense]|uniref:DUF4468 domain-containing protein n=1 Tax=Chryseobacterium oranimense TaxID=421058 RepID=A0A1M5WRG0_9FLAO|nr:hypothetical protein [Chryseobacterium oranimense]SHH89603.1 hypothetical protein SAMN05421866_4175 [Chryseobacterium oranimense]